MPEMVNHSISDHNFYISLTFCAKFEVLCGEFYSARKKYEGMDKVHQGRHITINKLIMKLLLTLLGMLFLAPPPSVLPERDWLRRGLVQYRRGEYGDAEVSFRRALFAKPGFAEAHYNLGQALYQQQRYAEALRCYQQAQPMLPSARQLSLWHQAGNAWLRLNHLPEAAAAYRQALKTRPDYAPTQKNLSYVLSKMAEKTVRKDVIRNLQQTRKKPGENTQKSDSDDKKESSEKSNDNNATQATEQSASRIQSPQTQLSKQDMETMLKQLDEAEKQIRGRTSQAKSEKTTKTEAKDW